MLALAPILFMMSAVPEEAPDPKAKDAVAEEFKKLAGEWEVQSTTLGGRAFPKSDPPVRYEIRSPVMRVVATGSVWLLELDPAKDPKRIKQVEGEMKENSVVEKKDGQVNKCVYSLDGDLLSLVIARGAKAEYPGKVEPEAGDAVLVMKLKRVKK